MTLNHPCEHKQALNPSVPSGAHSDSAPVTTSGPVSVHSPEATEAPTLDDLTTEADFTAEELAALKADLELPEDDDDE